jgi:Transposase DDE domain
MQRHPISAQPTFEDLLQDLPPDFQDMAIECQAFKRSRKVRSPMELMRLVLMYCGIDKTLRDVAGNFTLLRERITDTAVHKRLSGCALWLRAMLQKMWPGIKKLPDSLRLIVIDASPVSAPGAVGTSYRLQLAMDLADLSFIHTEVTDQHVGESLNHYPLTKNDITLLDRGYNHPKVILEHSLRGVSVVLRLSPHAMPLHRPDNDTKIDLYGILKNARRDEITVPVRLINKKQEPVTGWVHARRLPPEKREEARRKCRANSKSGAPKQETLLFSEWLLIFTTVSPKVVDRQAICALYSLRWQVELVFKRLKSLLDIDQLRCKEGSTLNDVWLYGKLLFATLLVKRSDRHFGRTSLDPECGRDITPWRLWKALKDEAITLITGALYWKPEQRKAAVDVLKERPRRRKLQTLPLPVAKLITDLS